MRAQTCECVVTVTDMRIKILKTSSTFRKVVLVGSSLELHSTWRTKTVVCRENCQNTAAVPTEPNLRRCWSHLLHVCGVCGDWISSWRREWPRCCSVLQRWVIPAAQWLCSTHTQASNVLHSISACLIFIQDKQKSFPNINQMQISRKDAVNERGKF